MRSSICLALAASATSALAQVKGFNYGSTGTNGAPYTQDDFKNLFNTAAQLSGTSGSFTSARLYTMVQGGTANTVISAIPAALSTGTKLLLGLWASGGDAGFANELSALRTAIQQFPQLSSQIVGISVGSEDLYRISPPAAQAGETNPGASPSTLTNYIGQVRSAISGTAWSGAPVGHVDTWTAFANSSNDAVSSACDFVGVDAYPYFQTVDANAIGNGLSLFQTALNSLTPAAKSKQIWITETGWPVSGKTSNQAVPSPENAKAYWDAVGCNFLFGKYNTWWYTLQDAGSNPSFGVVGSTLSTQPLFDLTCSGTPNNNAGSSSSSTAAASSAGSTATGSGSGSVSSSSSTTTSSGPVSRSATSVSSAPTPAATGTASVTGAPGPIGSGAATTSTTLTQAPAPAPATSGTGSSGTTAGSGSGSSSNGSTTVTTGTASTTRPAQNTNAANLLSPASGAIMALIAGGAAFAL